MEESWNEAVEREPSSGVGDMVLDMQYVHVLYTYVPEYKLLKLLYEEIGVTSCSHSVNPPELNLMPAR